MVAHGKHVCGMMVAAAAVAGANLLLYVSGSKTICILDFPFVAGGDGMVGLAGRVD